MDELQLGVTATVPAPPAQAWRACALAEHICDLLAVHREAAEMLAQVSDPRLEDGLQRYHALVTEVLEHLGGLHDDDCLVRPLVAAEA